MAKKKRGSKDIITDFAENLLRLFRRQQRTHGNIGCECGICRADMVKAVKKLIEEGYTIEK